MNKKIIILLIVILILLGAFFGWKIFSTQKSSPQEYYNEKYNFSIKYPSSWLVDEDKTFAGPGFRPKNLDIKNIQEENIDKNKDCYFMINFLSKAPNNDIAKTSICKNKVQEITLGLNVFTKCKIQETSSYVILHPKTKNIFDVTYLNNPTCETILNDSLRTLTFQ